MATPTYDLLDSTTLASSASSVTFSSLDTVAAGYRDLIIVVDAIGASIYAGSIRAKLNGDSGSNYNNVDMNGDGSSAGSGSSASSANFFVGRLSNSSGRGNSIIQFMDYSATDKHTTVLWRGNDPDYRVYAGAGRWANTAAVTSIELYNPDEFAATSTFYLYGIAS